MHVIPVIDGRRVEIQVRTARQNTWAQIVEKLGDTWGRQIRYGEEPNDPDTLVQPGATRRDVWQQIKEISEILNDVERAEAQYIVASGRSLTDPLTDEHLSEQLRVADDLLRSLSGLAL